MGFDEGPGDGACDGEVDGSRLIGRSVEDIEQAGAFVLGDALIVADMDEEEAEGGVNHGGGCGRMIGKRGMLGWMVGHGHCTR